MYKVLIVDDNPDNVRLLAADLEDEGYQVYSAYSGQEGLQICKEHDPDVLLLDMMMPDMDGLEVCQRLKDDEYLQNIPVIFISAKDDEETVIKGLNVGGNDYVMKPFSYPIVAARVRTAIRIKVSQEIILQKNEEMDQFTYSASHDLQQPIRQIISFSQLLEKKLDKIPDETAQYLTTIKNSAYKMSTLVTDLLKFGRLGRNNLEVDNIDLNACILDVTEVLNLQIKESHAHIESGTLPVVMADKTLITQLYQNLISNGIKFKSEDVNPVITLTAEKENGQTIFGVKDNGIGIPEKSVNNIFKPFIRLDSVKYPGTGIGLAFCKKIVDLHNGKIWVESNSGHGSHFKFTL